MSGDMTCASHSRKVAPLRIGIAKQSRIQHNPETPATSPAPHSLSANRESFNARIQPEVIYFESHGNRTQTGPTKMVSRLSRRKRA